MPIPKVAGLIADRLNAIRVKWMATGSIAAMTYGEYRVTNDIDLVLVLGRSEIPPDWKAFPLEDFYCPPADVIRETKRAGLSAAISILSTTRLVLRPISTSPELIRSAVGPWNDDKAFRSVIHRFGSRRPNTSLLASWNSIGKAEAKSICATSAGCCGDRRRSRSWAQKSRDAFLERRLVRPIRPLVASEASATKTVNCQNRLRAMRESVVLNEIATAKVTIVPKQIHHGNSITGSQSGCW